MPVSPSLRRLKLKDRKFKASLDYTYIARLYLKVN
jgi:hypothetical protein